MTLFWTVLFTMTLLDVAPLGKIYDIALRRNENDIKNLNFPHLARFSLRLNDIAHHVGLEKEDESPARDIGQRTLQR